MFTICKRFEFSAAHQLTHLPVTHQCARLHGHNYVVEVELEAESLDARGFVEDYGDLAPIKTYIDSALDHRFLNDVFGSAIETTAEAMARRFFLRFAREFQKISAIRVSETPKTWAEFRPSRTVVTLTHPVLPVDVEL